MKNYIIKAKRFLNILYVIPIMILTETILSSCTNEQLEIQQNFPFEVMVMPVPKDIAKDETVEIRIKIQPSGNFSETQYYLRYFQFEGTGKLKYLPKKLIYLMICMHSVRKSFVYITHRHQ